MPGRGIVPAGDDTPQLFPTLRGLWRFYNGRGEEQTAMS